MTPQRCQRFPFCALSADHSGDECEIRLQPGWQEQAAACSADGAIWSGHVGGGKSLLLLAEPLRWIHLPGFTALILRKEQRQLEGPGGLWQKAKQLYPAFGGEPKESEFLFTFPSGATVQFSYLDPRNYERQHQGIEVGFLGFDEFTHFGKTETLFMLTRNRSAALTAAGVPAYWRATCNPDPASWVAEFVAGWVGPAGWLDPARDGVTRYYLRRDGREVWADAPTELLQRYPRARREDVRSVAVFNVDAPSPYLDASYSGTVEEQDEEVRDRWKGNWHARSSKGKIFRPEWFLDHRGGIKQHLLVDRIPAGAVLIRPWDLAATPEHECSSETSHSWSAGPLLGLHEGLVYIGPAMIGRWDGGTVERIVHETAKIDGRDVRIWFCRERAGAGKSQLQSYVRLLQGYAVDGEPETGAKDVRLQPLAAQAKFGNVRFVRDEAAPPREDGHNWAGVATVIRHLLRLPDKPNDVGDALAAGYAQICGDDDSARQAGDVIEAFNELAEDAAELDGAFDLSGATKMGGW